MVKIDFLDFLMIAYMIINVLLIPHTKIEEIFQVNNIYDHLYLGFGVDKIKDYDYIIFDGVVYRTFLSSLMIAAIDFVFVAPIKMLGLTSYSMLITSRVTLGILNWIGVRMVRNAVHDRFGKKSSQCLALLFLVQFHSLFYFTRPLPNSFALIFCNMAFSYWL